MDFSGFPRPENAPRAGECVHIERPGSGLIVLTLDAPHRKLTVLDQPLLSDLARAIEQLEMDAGLRALVIRGADPTHFAAGADIDVIEELSDPLQVERLASMVQELFQNIASLSRRRISPVRTVAAVGGPVPGGAYELSLACDVIVACDHPSTRIGLPETQLGILPGWGGCQRLPRRVGVPKALEAILSGRLYPARAALRTGMVDRLAKPEHLFEVAARIATGAERVRKKRRGLAGILVDRNPLATTLIASQAQKRVATQTRGHYPAPQAALELVARAAHTSLARGLAAEARAVSELAVGTVCKNLISVFRLSEAAKKLGHKEEEHPPIERATVIGAGVMGGAIAGVLAERGVYTRLADLSADALDTALFEHRASVEKKRKRRRLQTHEAMAAIDRLDVTTDASLGMRRVQFAIEAVAEKLEIKRAVFGQLAATLAPEAILATNTSSLSVDAIAQGTPQPERVIGMHFFNPVRRMPLVEIVRGSRTSEAVVTQVARLALRMGKTPVIVKDRAGFLVNRLLGPYLDEALLLFQAGVDPKRIDDVAEDFGMPMGPLALLDEVGFDIATHAAESLHAAYGERMTPSTGLERIMASDRLGKKTGRGFYLHERGGKRKRGGSRTLCPDLVPSDSTPMGPMLSDRDIMERLVLAMVNEGARCLEDSVVESADELDLATIFGMGFPPFRGGLMRYADTLGAPLVIDRLEAIRATPDVTQRPGGRARFEPADLLRQIAGESATFRQRQSAVQQRESAPETRADSAVRTGV